MAITLTERAAEEVRRTMDEKAVEEGSSLRVAVAGGGCSGYSYSLNFDTTFDEKADSRYEYHGVPVVVDKKSLLLLDGTTIDFLDGIDRRGFSIQNPNAVKTCGCGSSFQA